MIIKADHRHEIQVIRDTYQNLWEQKVNQALEDGWYLLDTHVYAAAVPLPSNDSVIWIAVMYRLRPYRRADTSAPEITAECENCGEQKPFGVDANGNCAECSDDPDSMIYGKDPKTEDPEIVGP